MDLQHLCSMIQSLYSMNQWGIQIHECKHNITHIGKQYNICINRNRREFTTKYIVDLVEISPSWLVLPYHKAHLNVTLMHEYDDSLIFKAVASGHYQYPKSNANVVDGNKYIEECGSLLILIHLPI